MEPADVPRLVELWEASVRATHTFLTEEDIVGLVPLVSDALETALDVTVAEDRTGRLTGFSGISGSKLEALFVDPAAMGTGVGGALMRHALDVRRVWRVDVNEGNPSACAFYRKYGFRVRSRSATDGQGRPFPILHMEL
jgi:putative acetyltransferase